jgi:cation:H+ antiporter
MDTLINSYIAAFAGLMLLSYCADTLVESSIIIAKRFKLSKVFIGSAIIGFGSSLPEVMSTIKANTDNLPDLAVSTVIGSNIANIGIPLALCLLISKKWPDMRKNKLDLAFMAVAYVIFIVSSYFGIISKAQGIIMVILLTVFLLISLKTGREKDVKIDVDEEDVKEKNIIEVCLGVIVGLCGLAIGADLLINGATSIATDLNISEKIIGITLVALGTSLPEAAASISAARKGETGLVLGNIVGSNMFNILAALGITAALKPLVINDFNMDIIFLLITAALLLPFFFCKKGNNRYYGIALLVVYAIYMYWTFA